MRPILFEIPGIGIPVFAYGFMIMLGFVAATLYGTWRGKREGLDPNFLIDLGILVVLVGVIGSRIFYYVQFYDEQYANRSWLAIFMVWEGGLVFYGGLVLGTVAGIAFCLKRGVPVLKVADVVAPCLALALGFTRIGCFLNGCCWGKVCDPSFPLAVRFPRIEDMTGTVITHSMRHQMEHGLLPSDAGASLPVHPTQLYAVFLAFSLFALLHWLSGRPRRRGQVFAAFFGLYAIIRIGLEFWRGDNALYAGRLSAWQWGFPIVAILAFLAGTRVVARRHGIPAREWLGASGGAVILMGLLYGAVQILLVDPGKPSGLHISQWVGLCIVPVAAWAFVTLSRHGATVESPASPGSPEA